MNLGESESEAEEPGPLMALPGRTSDEGLSFHRYLAEVLDLVEAEVPTVLGPTDLDQYKWEQALRAAVVDGVSRIESWPEELFATLIQAAVHDPNPSLNRQLIKPALSAVGRRRVQETLLELLSSGTNAEKAGAARAWYCTQVPLRFNSTENLKARIPTPESQQEYDAVEDLRIRWQQAALQEFVSNEDLDVRRCILPGLTLNPARYPAGLQDLVATAVHMARIHPDEYIRHRVEHQV
jgi:hypothetical protein